MPKPAIYLRVSSEQQREKESIKSQEQALAAWLHTQGLTADDVAWYRDDGVSGKDPILERGDGKRLAADIRAGAVSGFVATFSISRIARDASDYHLFRAFLRDKGLHLLGAAEGVDTRNEAGEFVAGMHALIAEEQHRTMIKSIRAGKQRVAREGKWQGRPPYGYTVADGRLEIDPATAPVVRTIFQLYLSGMGVYQIVNHLKAHSIPAPRGGSWYHSALQVILTNPAYTGAAAWNRTKTRRGHRIAANPRAEHVTIPAPAIIDKATFDRAQQVRAHRGHRFEHTGAGAAHVLLSRVRCLACGAPYNRAKHDKSDAYYYRHSRYAEPYRQCPGRNIPAALLDEAVWGELYAAITDPAKWRETLSERLQAATRGDAEEKAYKDAAAALERVERQLDRLEEAYLNEVIDLARYSRKAESLNAQKRQWQRNIEAIEEARRRRSEEVDNAASLAEVMAQYRHTADNADTQLRQAIAERLLAEVRARYVKRLEVELRWGA